MGRGRSPRSSALFARSPAASITEGFDVLVQEVMAAITTSPCPSSTASSASPGLRGPAGWAAGAASGRQRKRRPISAASLP